MSDWVRNSGGHEDNINVPYVNATYFMMAVSVLILMHSTLINWKTPWRDVRVRTDIAASFTLLSGIFLLSALATPTTTVWAVLIDFFYNGIFAIVIQLCDNYMFFNRYKAVAKPSMFQSVLVHGFIWLVLVLPWAVTFTIVPFFYDTNTDFYTNVYYPYTNYLYSYGTLAFNVYFTVQFGLILRKLYRPIIAARSADECEEDDRIPTSESSIARSISRMKVISIKSLIHCVTSSVASVLYTESPDAGYPMYNIIIILGLHLLFNCKIEKQRWFLYLWYYLSDLYQYITCNYSSRVSISAVQGPTFSGDSGGGLQQHNKSGNNNHMRHNNLNPNHNNHNQAAEAQSIETYNGVLPRAPTAAAKKKAREIMMQFRSGAMNGTMGASPGGNNTSGQPMRHHRHQDPGASRDLFVSSNGN
jgi:hypothetical protein